jgi:hypothetical protein
MFPVHEIAGSSVLLFKENGRGASATSQEDGGSSCAGIPRVLTLLVHFVRRPSLEGGRKKRKLDNCATSWIEAEGGTEEGASSRYS